MILDVTILPVYLSIALSSAATSKKTSHVPTHIPSLLGLDSAGFHDAVLLLCCLLTRLLHLTLSLSLPHTYLQPLPSWGFRLPANSGHLPQVDRAKTSPHQ
jgi:hypothetical protein